MALGGRPVHPQSPRSWRRGWRRLPLLAVLATPLTHGAGGGSGGDNCTVTAPGGLVFALDRAVLPASAAGDIHYAVSACTPFVPAAAQPWPLFPACRCAAPAYAFQVTSGSYCYSLGAERAGLVEASREGLAISFGGGTDCGGAVGARRLRLLVECVGDAADEGAVNALEDCGACCYTIRARSRAGCPLGCARARNSAVCGGASRGACVVSEDLRSAACSCREGFSGLACEGGGGGGGGNAESAASAAMVAASYAAPAPVLTSSVPPNVGSMRRLLQNFSGVAGAKGRAAAAALRGSSAALAVSAVSVAALGLIIIAAARRRAAGPSAGKRTAALAVILALFAARLNTGGGSFDGANIGAAGRGGLRQLGAHVEPQRDLPRTAFVTYVMGDEHARMALALLQSLRDFNTVHELVVLVARRGDPPSAAAVAAAAVAAAAKTAACSNSSATASMMNSSGASPAAPCTLAAPISAFDSLISPTYVRAFERLGAELREARSVPRSPFTENIAGGSYSFWGAAFNKIQVFALTEFRRVVYMDADSLALQSLDHLFGPDVAAGPHDFTAAFTVNCCVQVSGKMGGGLFVFEPSKELYERVLRKSFQPAPEHPSGFWREGDQRILASAVGLPFARAGHFIETWPWLRDYRQGLAPGFSLLPHHRGRPRAEIEADIRHSVAQRFPAHIFGDGADRFNFTEGPLPRSLWPPCAASLDADDSEEAPIWHPLDARYDIVVGSCECLSHHDLAGRIEQDSVGVQMSAHYSCLKVEKPGAFDSERALMELVHDKLPSCMRWYYLRWHDAFARAMGGPLSPRWAGPPVPSINTTHDTLIQRPW